VPWEKGWRLVQEANMAKRRVEKGQGGKDDHHLSIIKPEGWKPPMILELLAAVLDGSVDVNEDLGIAGQQQNHQHAHGDTHFDTLTPEHVDGFGG
jgi:hypothetical protein